MKFLLSLFLVIATAVWAGLSAASAHVSVGGDRTLGTINAGETQTNFVRTVSGSFGWADAADANWGDSHRTTAFKFTLASAQTVSILVQRNDMETQTGAAGILLPAFSLYTAPLFQASTHDAAPPMAGYLNGLFGNSATGESFTDAGGLNGFWDVGEPFVDGNGNGVYDGPGIANSGKEGALRALDAWKIFVDVVGGAEMNFNFIGHAADGSAANYGNASGINGDGAADGVVAATFHNLAAGDYYLFVGGAHYQAQNTEAPVHGPSSNAYPTYGIGLTVTAVPEPASAMLFALSAGGLVGMRRRRSKSERITITPSAPSRAATEEPPCH